MKTILKMFIFAAFALSIKPVYAQTSTDCPVTTVHVAYNADTKQDAKGASIPKSTIIVVQTEDADGIPTETKYYLGVGWQPGTTLSEDGLHTTFFYKDAATSSTKKYSTTIKYTTNKGEWSYTRTEDK